MKKIFSIFVLLSIIQLIGIGQNVIIKGKIVDGDKKTPLKSVSIFINKQNSNVTDDNGLFSFSIPQKLLKKKIMIRYPAYFGLDIINLPRELNEINLDTISLFYYFTKSSLAYSFPAQDNQIQNKLNELITQEAKRINQYYSKRDSIISSYRYYFRGNQYKIDLKNKYINLMKTK